MFILVLLLVLNIGRKYLADISILGILFDEIPTSNYLEIAFIFGLQTLQSIDLGRIYCLTPSLYCMGPKVSEPKKWLVPKFIFKGWEWCI